GKEIVKFCPQPRYPCSKIVATRRYGVCLAVRVKWHCGFLWCIVVTVPCIVYRLQADTIHLNGDNGAIHVKVTYIKAQAEWPVLSGFNHKRVLKGNELVNAVRFNVDGVDGDFG